MFFIAKDDITQYNKHMKHTGIIVIIAVIIGLIGVGLASTHIHKSTPAAPSQSSSTTPPISLPQTSTVSRGSIPDIPFQLPSNVTVHIFSSETPNARDIIFSPGGVLLVSSPATNSIYALPDTNHDGVADTVKTVVSQGNQVHGLAFYNNHLFVAEVQRVVRYTWDEKNLSATFDKELFTLPANNNHNKRTIVIDDSGTMYVSVGSTCNVCQENSTISATILVSNSNGDNPRIYAQGLRNAPFMAFNPITHELWATEMGRDNIGDENPPDEINIIHKGTNYGWPYCYGNRVHDTQFDPTRRDPCSQTTAPIYEIPAHSAPLGLVFINSTQFPTDWQHDLLVAYHGSWNRTEPTGYKIVHLKVNGNSIVSSDDFMTGFLPNNARSGNDALGRPVDLTFDTAGNLYISDDKKGAIYIVQKQP